MPFPGVRPQPEMTDDIRGAFGSFTLVGPRQISFINTRFATNKLGLLKTARRIIPRELMTIRELMQRDIDDERVRTEIVAYLKPQAGIDSPRFFPPIVVAVLVRDQNAIGRLAVRYPGEARSPVAGSRASNQMRKVYSTKSAITAMRSVSGSHWKAQATTLRREHYFTGLIFAGTGIASTSWPSMANTDSWRFRPFSDI